MLRRLAFYITVTILIFAGCAPEIQELVEVVLGKKTAAEVLSVLKARSENAAPLLAKGRCILRYYDADKKKHKKEPLTFRVLMNPPVEIYLQGDATLAPKAIVLGSNEHEFWLLVRPKEISTYWWGKWSEQGSSEGLTINPQTLFEALGVVETGAEENWSLSNKGAFNVLIRRERGVVIKKMYVFRRNYLVKRIEYFDSKGQAVAYTELGNYRKVSEGFSIPTSIKINAYSQDNVEDSLSITLNLMSIRPEEITERKRNVYFKRPKPRGFEHILENKDGTWIEQRK